MSSRPLVQIALSVRDVQHSQRWYRDLFGVTEAGGTHMFIPLLGSEKVQGIPGSTSVCWWVRDAQDTFQVELFEFSKPHPKPVPEDWRPCDIGYTMASVHVTDFDGMLERLKKRQVSHYGPILGGPGERRVCITDPDGTLIELLESDPRVEGMAPRPEGAFGVARSVTLSVPNLDEARRTWVDVLGLPVVDVALHSPEHEALWGLEGATRESFVVQAGDRFIEVVQYLDPLGKPWPAGYQISDIGILNIALAYESMDELQDQLRICEANGIFANSSAGTVVDKWWYAAYVNDPMGFSIELLFHGSRGKKRPIDPFNLLELGFTTKPAPVKRAEARGHTSASPEEVWAVLIDHEGMSRWTPFASSEVLSAGEPNDVGLVRRLSGGPAKMTITERITAAEAPHRLEYRAKGAPGQKRYYAFVSVEPDGRGGSDITWEAQFRSPLPGSTRLTQTVLRKLVDGLISEVESRDRASVG